MSKEIIHQWFPLLTFPIIWAFGGILVLLTLFQIVVWLKMKKNFRGKFGDLQKRLVAWWYIIGIFAVIFLTRQWCLILLWMGISLLALHEYFHVIPKTGL